MKRETLDRFVHKEVTLTFTDGEIAQGTLEYDIYHSNKYILKRPTEDCDIVFPASVVKSIGSYSYGVSMLSAEEYIKKSDLIDMLEQLKEQE